MISDYHMSCFVCGFKVDLMMMAHRDGLNRIVGWLFCCDKCKESLKDKYVATEIVDNPEPANKGK